MGKGAPPFRRPSSPFTEAKFQRGWALQQQGEFVEAERLYDEILQLEPRHPAALTLLGAVACKRVEPSAASG